MGLNDKASDWQVAGIAQVGGAAAVGGGVWWFEFNSVSAGVREVFMYLGGGIGMGGSVGGASAPDLSNLGNAKPAYSPLECPRRFSVDDLDMSVGRLTTVGASLAVGYGLVYISAFNLQGAMFSSQSVGGLAIGVGLGGITTVGYWRSTTIVGQDANRVARRYSTQTTRGAP